MSHPACFRCLALYLTSIWLHTCAIMLEHYVQLAQEPDKTWSTLCTWWSMIMCCEVLGFLFPILVGCHWHIWFRSCGKLGRELGIGSSLRLDSWLPCEHNMNVGWLWLVSQSVLSLYEHLTKIVITLSAHLTLIPCLFNDMCLNTGCLDACEVVNILHETFRPGKDGWLCHAKQWGVGFSTLYLRLWR